jgi:hypothetical protein
VGRSWEAFVIENVVAFAGRATPYFYRTSAGAEIDLLLVWPDGSKWAVEIKRSLDPRPERGFHIACADVQADRRFIAYPGSEEYHVARDISAVPPERLAALVANESGAAG